MTTDSPDLGTMIFWIGLLAAIAVSVVWKLCEWWALLRREKRRRTMTRRFREGMVEKYETVTASEGHMFKITTPAECYYSETYTAHGHGWVRFTITDYRQRPQQRRIQCPTIELVEKPKAEAWEIEFGPDDLHILPGDVLTIRDNGYWQIHKPANGRGNLMASGGARRVREG